MEWRCSIGRARFSVSAGADATRELQGALLQHSGLRTFFSILSYCSYHSLDPGDSAVAVGAS